MKKSFILSLVMVVVLIASLATATYAWYTQQTRVDATDTTVYTAQTGATLVISAATVADAGYTNNTVTLTLGETAGEKSGVQPMVIDAGSAPAIGDAYSSLAFLTTTLNAAKKANDAGAAGTPATLTNVNDTVNNGTKIFVANTGKAAATYKVTVTITDSEANNGLRVAVYRGTTAAEFAAYTLVGIWAPASEKVGYIDAIVAGTQYSGLVPGAFDGTTQITAGTAETAVFVSGTASTSTSTLAAYNGTIAQECYTVVAWYEGDKINNTYAGKQSSFAIKFDI